MSDSTIPRLSKLEEGRKHFPYRASAQDRSSHRAIHLLGYLPGNIRSLPRCSSGSRRRVVTRLREPLGSVRPLSPELPQDHVRGPSSPIAPPPCIRPPTVGRLPRTDVAVDEIATQTPRRSRNFKHFHTWPQRPVIHIRGTPYSDAAYRPNRRSPYVHVLTISRNRHRCSPRQPMRTSASPMRFVLSRRTPWPRVGSQPASYEGNAVWKTHITAGYRRVSLSGLFSYPRWWGQQITHAPQKKLHFGASGMRSIGSSGPHMRQASMSPGPGMI